LSSFVQVLSKFCPLFVHFLSNFVQFQSSPILSCSELINFTLAARQVIIAASSQTEDTSQIKSIK
jgi:hypothetical protein